MSGKIERTKELSSLAKKGFTLIELAFVLVIIGLLISAGAELLPMLVKQSKFKQNQILVNDAKTAIMGYALATGRLPYASTNIITGTAVANTARGYLPWATLGIPGKDAYLNTLFYAVDPYLANTTSAIQLKTHLSELINGTHAPSLFCNGVLYKEAFVVISAGENRRANSPNDDNGDGVISVAGDNNQFADPSTVPTPTNDDILAAESLTTLLGFLP
jgi:prepilin-type N-terminal cleavage/methylation domain-containing protein